MQTVTVSPDGSIMEYLLVLSVLTSVKFVVERLQTVELVNTLLTELMMERVGV